MAETKLSDIEQETILARNEATSAANDLLHILNPATTGKVYTLKQAEKWLGLVRVNVGRSRWGQVQVTHKNEYDAYVAAMKKLRDKEKREYDATKMDTAAMKKLRDKRCRSIRL